MKILITDGYKKADFLLSQISFKEHKVTFVHDDSKFADKMLSKYEKLEVYIGDTSDPEVLPNLENIKYDVLICLANDDAKNFVICNICQKKLDIAKRVTMIANPNNQIAFKKLGIEGTVSASHLITNIINKLATINDVISYVAIDNDASVHPYEQKILPNFSSVGKQLKELIFPDSCIVCCIVRGEISIIPNGEDHILAGDHVVVFTNVDDDKLIKKVFL